MALTKKASFLPAAAVLLLVGAHGAVQAQPQPMAGRISNIIIGGGLLNCSSMSGPADPANTGTANNTARANCAKPWADIVAQDPAFAGLTVEQLQFERAITLPNFSYRIDAARIAALNALPETLLSAASKAALNAQLKARLAEPLRANSGLSFADVDGVNAVFADGQALWQGSTPGHAPADVPKFIALLCDGHNTDADAVAANGKRCRLSDANLAAVAASAFANPEDGERVGLILRELQRRLGSEPILFHRQADGSEAANSFRAEFQRTKLARDGTAPREGLSAALSSSELAVLLETLVEPLPPAREQRKLQARSAVFLNNPPTRDIYRVFVDAATAAAGGRQPTIGLVTAASRNPYNERDINYFALKSAGAKVVWLPANGGLRRAIDTGDCANTAAHYSAYANLGVPSTAPWRQAHMDQVFPDLARTEQDFCADKGALFSASVQELDGIYFSGGDQARLLESFISRDSKGNYTQVSEQLRILRSRYAAGRLVVAGSSAGDSAQSGGLWRGKPVPMISGGESWSTLVNGFISGSGPTQEGVRKGGVGYPAGGLGFFKFGPLDSHFSHRSREGRLVRFVMDSQMDYGFGVDENTALLVSHADAAGNTLMSVVGAAGVFIVDVRRAQGGQSGQGRYTLAGATIHYLTAGDSARIDSAGQLSVTLSTAKPLLAAVAAAPAVQQSRVQEPGSFNFLKMSRAMGLTGASEALGTTEGASATAAATATSSSAASLPHYGLLLSRTPASEFRADSNGSLSYTNVLLSLKPCSGACVPENGGDTRAQAGAAVATHSAEKEQQR